jgi:hypothetical protein
MMILTAIGFPSPFFLDDTNSLCGLQAKIIFVSRGRIHNGEGRGRANQCKLKN